MPGLFSRIKTWIFEESVNSADLNAEFDNLITNFVPNKIDDYSASVGQMQTTTSPGGVGTESQATSLAGELERIRFVINRLVGAAQWYAAPAISLAEASNSLGQQGAFPNNRIVSGKVRSASSNQPLFLSPHGALPRVTLKGSTTPFVYYVNGTQYTINADVVINSMGVAPSSNNTCLINDATWDTITPVQQGLIGQLGTSYPDIIVDNMGSEISSLVGKWAAFALSTEYFIAFVESTTKLTKCHRGFFFGPTDVPIPPTNSGTDNMVITLQRLVWVYAKTDGTIEASYTNPTFSGTQPGSPASGDFWFDMINQTWKRYDGASFVASSSTLVGIVLNNTTGAVAARSFDFHKQVSDLNTLAIEVASNTEIRSVTKGAKINVYGALIDFKENFAKWNTTDNLDSGVTISASTYYYIYVTDTGKTMISNIVPNNRQQDLLGYYHPSNPWRCVGCVATDGSAHFIAAGLISFANPNGSKLLEAGVVGTANIASQAVTAAKMEAVGAGGPGSVGTPIAVGKIATSNSCGPYATTSLSLVDVTNLDVTLNITGNRPVWVGLVHDGNATPGQDGNMYIVSPGAGNASAAFQIYNSSQVARMGMVCNMNGMGNYLIPCTAIQNVFVGLPAGPNNFKVRVALVLGTNVQINYAKLVAFEL